MRYTKRKAAPPFSPVSYGNRHILPSPTAEPAAAAINPILLVKPALPYLDVLRDVRQAYDLPLAAYQVSGEYAMIQAAAMNGWLDLKRSALESLMAIKRAGADMILTYFAKDAAQWLNK